jgi:hypothetical protein
MSGARNGPVEPAVVAETDWGVAGQLDQPRTPCAQPDNEQQQ